MKIPEGYTEQEVLDIIEKISSRLASKFKFGYHGVDDMKQQAAIFALEGMENYDGVRPLDNFLWVHVRNRLYNFKRDNYFRPTPPCLKCPLNAYIDGKCTAYDNMMHCDIYYNWEQKNSIKQNLNNAIETIDRDDGTDFVTEEINVKEAIDIIEQNLPVYMREDWIKFKNKIKISKSRRDAMLEKIHEIMEEYDIGT